MLSVVSCLQAHSVWICWPMRSNRTSSDKKTHHHLPKWNTNTPVSTPLAAIQTLRYPGISDSFHGYRICQVSSRIIPAASLTAAGKGDTDRCIDGIRSAELWRLHQCCFIEAVICRSTENQFCQFYHIMHGYLKTIMQFQSNYISRCVLSVGQ